MTASLVTCSNRKQTHETRLVGILKNRRVYMIDPKTVIGTLVVEN